MRIYYLGLILSLFFGIVEKSPSKQTAKCNHYFSNLYYSHFTYPQINILLKNGNPPPKNVEETLRATLNKFSQLVQGKLEIPQDLTLILEPPGDTAYFVDRTIHMPIDYRSVNYKKHPKQTEAVFAHEWGHPFFELNLKKYFPALFEGRTKEEFTVLFSPYSELFSDIIAVMHLKDGRAARDALFNPREADFHADNFSAHLRDFTENHKLKNWPYEGPYALLSPVRNWLWENYLDRPKAYRESGALLKALIETIGNQMTFRFNNMNIQQTPEKINQDFMNDFKKRMEQLGH